MRKFVHYNIIYNVCNCLHHNIIYNVCKFVHHNIIYNVCKFVHHNIIYNVCKFVHHNIIYNVCKFVHHNIICVCKFVHHNIIYNVCKFVHHNIMSFPTKLKGEKMCDIKNRVTTKQKFNRGKPFENQNKTRKIVSCSFDWLTKQERLYHVVLIGWEVEQRKIHIDIKMKWGWKIEFSICGSSWYNRQTKTMQHKME